MSHIKQYFCFVKDMQLLLLWSSMLADILSLNLDFAEWFVTNPVSHCDGGEHHRLKLCDERLITGPALSLTRVP